jgi:hypothetical protein
LKENRRKVRGEPVCLGHLHIATVGTDQFLTSNISAELFALLCGMFNCQAARLVDLCGQRTKVAHTKTT